MHWFGRPRDRRRHAIPLNHTAGALLSIIVTLLQLPAYTKCQSYGDPVATDPSNTDLTAVEPLGVPLHQSPASVRQPVTTVISDKVCHTVDSPLCMSISNHTTPVSPFLNSFNHTLSAAIIELNKYVFLLAQQSCGMKIGLFLCSLYVPVCVESDRPYLLPCRDECEQARRFCTADLHAANMTWPEEWNCLKFQYYRVDHMCVTRNTSLNETDIADNGSSRYNNNNPPQLGRGTTNGSLDFPYQGKQSIHHRYTHAQSSNNSESISKTLCSPDMFDCRITDQSEAQRAVCIQMDFVCDGKHDCPRNNDGIGLDEVDCIKVNKVPNNDCTADEFYCDFRCISNTKRCDGKTDCSDGIDETSCFENYQFEKYAVIILVASIILFIQCIRKIRCDDQGDVENGDMYLGRSVVDNAMYSSGNVTSGDICSIRAVSEHDDIIDKDPHDDVTNHPKLYPRLTPAFERPNDHANLIMANYEAPIYQEPNTATGVYERLAVGGYSGASSVYAAYDIDDFDQPAAPPPTPHPMYS